MYLKDPKLIVLLFNECINNQDIDGLSDLLANEHTFIDRDGNTTNDMVNAYRRFFNDFPTYKKHIERIESDGDFVVSLGYAKWFEDSSEKDYAIWTAKIKDNRIMEWRIYHYTEENRSRFF